MKFRPACVVMAAAALAGCGSSGPSDKDQIAAIIKHEGTNPVSLCDHLTDALLARLGGKSGCRQEAAAAATDPTTRASSVTVHGNSASAVVVNRAGRRIVAFVKQKGVWKVSGVS